MGNRLSPFELGRAAQVPVSKRAVAIVQARMSSTRLPGKVLIDLAGRTALEMVLGRLARARQLDQIVVATSEREDDTPIVELADSIGVPAVRGSLEDVLSRYTVAASRFGADAIVRITADCPLVVPELVDKLVARWRQGNADYVSNAIHPPSFPKGLDVEVLSRAALERAASEAKSDYEREHVTPYIYTRPDLFSLAEIRLRPPAADLRVTLDTDEDLRALRQLISRIGDDPSLEAIFAALGRKSAEIYTPPSSA